MAKSCRLVKAEAMLRFLALFLMLAAAILIGANKETEEVFGIIKETANLRSLQAFIFLVVTDSIAAGYLLVQLCRGLLPACCKPGDKCSTNVMACINFILDQAMAYITFAVAAAATQGSSFAVSGETHFQWMRLCNIYTKFCDRVAVGLICSLAASFAIATVSSISACNLFRLYPSRHLVSINE